jgi:hypothetical protein
MFEYISTLLKNFFKKEEILVEKKEEPLKYINIDTEVTKNSGIKHKNSEIELDEKCINYKNFVKKRKYSKNKRKHGHKLKN